MLLAGSWNVKFFNHYPHFSSHNPCYYEPQRDYFQNDSLHLDSVFQLGGLFEYFALGDTMLFYADATQGQQWTANCPNGGTNFNQILFTCDSIVADSLFGLADSSRYFHIQTLPSAVAPLNGFVFRLSKNFGLVDFIPFWYLLHHTNALTTPILTLRGAEDSLGKYGYYFPDFFDFFNFQIGTVLHYYTDVWLGSGSGPWFEDRDSITNVQIIGDTVTIQFEYEHGDYASCCSYGSSSNVFAKSDFAGLFDKAINLVVYSPLLQTAISNLHANNYPIWGIANFSSQSDSIREFDLFGDLDTVICNHESDPVYQFESCDVEKFQLGLGRTGYCHGSQSGGVESFLEGYCHNGFCVGNVNHLHPTGINAQLLSPNSHIVISPNPTSNSFVIQNSSSQNRREGTLEIADVFGRVVLRYKIQADLHYDVSMLPAGIYIVRLITSGGVKGAKLIIER